MIHQGTAGTRGAPRDMEIHLREVLSTTKRMAEIIAFHTGQPLEKVEQDIDRDYFMTPEEAKTYGIIDDIIVPTRGLWAPRDDQPDDLEREVVAVGAGRDGG
jgi:ATP-dependent Clp protease protease subunit